jgi:hypothetical protein
MRESLESEFVKIFILAGRALSEFFDNQNSSAESVFQIPYFLIL